MEIGVDFVLQHLSPTGGGTFSYTTLHAFILVPMAGNFLK
jgi:hypothetical protein